MTMSHSGINLIKLQPLDLRWKRGVISTPDRGRWKIDDHDEFSQ
jgi:hypothetical protein